MHGFWLGVASGFPMMLAIGPIALLLVELGIERGVARAWPAAAGVVGADLAFASIAAASGAAVQHVMQPYLVPMRWAAAAVLIVMAVVMCRRAVRQIVALRSGESTTEFEGAVVDESPFRLAARLAALTAMSPISIIAFTSVVVASGARAAVIGWPLGIALSSVVVHGGLVGLGSSLRRALTPMSTSVLRVAGSVAVAGLATNLVLR